MQLLENVYAVQSAVPVSLVNPLPNVTSLADIFGMVINLIIGVGWALVFVMLALGFVQYVMSRGEAKATDSARQWLTFAVIGGVGLFLVTVLKNILPQLIGGTSTPVANVVF